MRWWICAAGVLGCGAGAAADEPRPVRVYAYHDALSTDFARSLTATLVVAGAFLPANEQHAGDQLSLVLGQDIKPVSADASKIRYDIEFRDSNGATLGFVSGTCTRAKFQGCFGPIVTRAVQISTAMGVKR